jgi:cell division protein FtsW
MLIWIGLVAGLVYLEPNFSTATLILIISTIVLIIGRVRIKDLFITSLAIIPVIVLYLLTKPNQLGRIKDYISGSHSSPQVNYQLWQGIIGFGNGGIFGVGPGASKQRDFFLPESYGDFVFSIVGEEYGLIGTIIIMGLFFLIMLRGFRIANNAPNAYGKLIAVGITTTITIYAIVNAGVTLGIFPTTGLPMPFVSYGGSNLLFSCFAIGVLLNISSQTTMYPRELPVQLDTPQGGLIDSSKGRVY